MAAEITFTVFVAHEISCPSKGVSSQWVSEMKSEVEGEGGSCTCYCSGHSHGKYLRGVAMHTYCHTIPRVTVTVIALEGRYVRLE